MTNEQAITKLTNIMHDDLYAWHPSVLTAFGMAVDALKGADGDCISRQGLIESLLSEDYEVHDYCFPCKEIMKRIDEQPSAQPTQSNTSNALQTMDCIDRQAAIDALADYIHNVDKVYSTGKLSAYDCRDAARSVLDELPSAQPEQRWIPVTERLPEKPYGCLVTVWDTEPLTCEEFENILPYFVGWDGEQWNDAEGIQCPFEVIAWMPLPEPARLDGE